MVGQRIVDGWTTGNMTTSRGTGGSDTVYCGTEDGGVAGDVTRNGVKGTTEEGLASSGIMGNTIASNGTWHDSTACDRTRGASRGGGGRGHTGLQ